MKRTSAFPSKLVATYEGSERHQTFSIRGELHNDRPAWDLDGSLHHSICWNPTELEYGFWAIANLWTTTDDGQATGIMLEMPEVTFGDDQRGLPPTWTQSEMPPMGWWTRGRPWTGEHTPGGRQMHLSIDVSNDKN